MAAAMLLQHRQFDDNVHLCTSIMAHLATLRRQGRTVELVWLPSHIGVAGNEAADRAANEGHLLPTPSIHVAPSISKVQAAIRRTAAATTSAEHRAEVLRGSPSATWYAQATGLEPPNVPPSMPQRTAAIIHRLRLGFPCWDELQGNISSCSYCNLHTTEPLSHYILACPATDRIRQIVGSERAEADDAAADEADDAAEALGTRQEAALLLKRFLANEDGIKIMTSFPPPR